MIMKHVLLELYCDYNKENEGDKPLGCNVIGYNCIKINCKHLSHTYCPYEIAFTDNAGIVESFDDCIGFGGEMEPETNNFEEREILLREWKAICKKKIDEAYDEYMEFKTQKR